MLFSPSGAPDAYYAEFGWVPAAGTTAAMPGPNTVWKQQGSGALGIDHPVTLAYDNGQGLVFTRTITVDDRYLFTIKDQVANNAANPVTLFPYALTLRHGAPKVQGYYILHEGLIGVLGDQGGADRKPTRKWTTRSPRVGRPPTPGSASPTTLGGGAVARYRRQWQGRGSPPSRMPGCKPIRPITCWPHRPSRRARSASADARLFAGAKEVSVVGINFVGGVDGGYNEQLLLLNHFDLLIDWGWFYFITKPMFLGIDYFFHVVGNFGIAILIVTVIVKLLFFPLANKSYASMQGKMKWGAAADARDRSRSVTPTTR